MLDAGNLCAEASGESIPVNTSSMVIKYSGLLAEEFHAHIAVRNDQWFHMCLSTKISWENTADLCSGLQRQ